MRTQFGEMFVGVQVGGPRSMNLGSAGTKVKEAGRRFFAPLQRRLKHVPKSRTVFRPFDTLAFW